MLLTELNKMVNKNPFPNIAEDTNINFYNANAGKWHAKVTEVNTKATCDKFLRHLPKKAHLLDLGCGDGRDTKYFLERGYQVTAVDGSEELVKCARDYTGHSIILMKFNELHYLNEFDGIWAMASLLHLSQKNLLLILEKNVLPSLKHEGMLYMSFKYGQGEHFFNGRYFCDYNENSLKNVIKAFDNLKLVELWKTEGKSKDNFDFINCIVQKTTLSP